MRCSNGHEWEAVADDPAPGGGTVLGCPVCGAPQWSPVGPETPPPGPSDEPWPVVPGYEVLGEIGRGGMGVVYKARHLKLNRLTALKVIRKERLAHPDAVRRFRREAQAAARLSHPNIVLVYECDQDGDTHFLAMEYVPGLTLQRLVEQSGPLSVGQACHLMRQAALALQHASEQGLVHRDVKPSNLMVVAPGGKPPPRPVVKVLDMGVARLHPSANAVEESMTTLTRDGAVIGTPDYVAPEQLENPHGADMRADLYSLGCTFYFLLSGRVPFPGGTLLQKLDRQRWETPPSVDQLRPDVPPAAAAVIRKLMAKRPDDRYRTAAALAAAPGGADARWATCRASSRRRRSAKSAVSAGTPGRSRRRRSRRTARRSSPAARIGPCGCGTWKAASRAGWPIRRTRSAVSPSPPAAS